MPTYFEIKHKTNGGVSYQFVKRTNPKAGNYPLLKDKVSFKLKATTKAEAIREAQEAAAALDHLQLVAKRDAGNHLNSTKDLNKAADTWVRLIAEIDLQALKSHKGKNTLAALEDKEALEFFSEEVAEFFETRELDHEGAYRSWLTPFGDHLLKLIRDGRGTGSLSEGIEIYLKQTQRDHLDEKTNSVRTIQRVAEYFIDAVGDKELDQISRKDVENYITVRREKVKTTSVQREIRSLSALWNRCADVLDIRNRNPFANQPIKGLGTDSIERITPTASETSRLLKLLEAKALAAPTSYVWPLIAICALTGARLSEAWGLIEADWIKERGTLLIRPNATRKSLKTSNSVRPIPVLAPLAFWLERYFYCVEKSLVAKSSNAASSASVKALKKQGFAFGNHSLRHGMKQRLVEADAPINVIEELMGWSSQSMARNYGTNQASTTKRNFMACVYQNLGLATELDTNVVMLRRGI